VLFFVIGATGKLGRHVVAGCSTDQERSGALARDPRTHRQPDRSYTPPDASAISIVPRAADLAIPTSTKHRPRRN